MTDFDINVYEPPVPEPYKTQAKILSEICFADFFATDPKEREEQKDQFASEKDWYKFVFALENNQVIAKVTTLKRTILFDGQEILLGGLGGVCTNPQKRRQGIATALVDTSMNILTDAKCDIAYLCTDINDPERVRLYGKYGFVPLRRKHTYLGASGKRYADDDAMIAPVCSPEIFRQVLEATEPFDIGIGNW